MSLEGLRGACRADGAFIPRLPVESSPDFVPELFAQFFGVCMNVQATHVARFLQVSIDPRIFKPVPDGPLEVLPTEIAAPSPGVPLLGSRVGASGPMYNAALEPRVVSGNGTLGDAAPFSFTSCSRSEDDRFRSVQTLFPLGCSSKASSSPGSPPLRSCIKGQARSSTCAPALLQRRVSFSFEVSFWFPGPSQCCLPPAATDARHVGFRQHLLSATKARHVGFRQPSFGPGPAQASQVLHGTSSALPHLSPGFTHASCLAGDLHVNPVLHGPGSPVCVMPKKGSGQRKLVASFGASPFQPPAPSHHPGLAVPLEHAGYRRTPAAQLSTGGKYTEMATVFTSFDSTWGARTLVGDRQWTQQTFINFAISTARLGGTPHGRIAIFEAPALPSPQVIITQPGADPVCRAVLFDLRHLGLDVEALEVSAGNSILSSLRMLSQLPDGHEVFERLQAKLCCCSVNGVFHEAEAPLVPDADLVQVHLVARPFCLGDARPPVPPIPSTALGNLASGSSSSNNDGQHALLPFLSAVVPVADGEARYSVLGTIEGVVNHPKDSFWTDNQCLLDALAKAAGPRAFLGGLVLTHPLLGLFVPQVLLTRTAPSAGLVTVACDLRALRLGISVFEFRFGSTLRDLVSPGSVLFGELAQLGREHVVCSFLINGSPASPDTVLSGATETVTLIPADLSRTAAQSTQAAGRWQSMAGSGATHGDAYQYTVFDHVHHFRVLPRQRSDTWDDLAGHALSVTPELPHAVAHALEHVVPGLPLPQLVLLSSALGGFVVPVIYSFRPLSVCTVEVPCDASAFQTAYQCSSSCHALRSAHNQVARGTAFLAGRNGVMPQFRAGHVHGHEAVTLQGFQPGAIRPRNVPSSSTGGMPRWVEARTLKGCSSLEGLNLDPRRPAIRLPLSSLLSYEDSKRRILQANRFGPGASVVWPFLRPPGTPSVSLVCGGFLI